MAYEIRITEPAKFDAQEYAQYIRDKERSVEAASKWLRTLLVEIEKLRDMPSRFAVIPEGDELGTAYRSFNYYSHRVIYAVNEEAQIVTIHRIYHGARAPLAPDDVH